MSSFLHSPAWERFQNRIGNAVIRHDGQLLIGKKVSIAKYWLASRFIITNSFSLPQTGDAHFLRIEPVDTSSLENLKATAAKLGHKLEKTIAVQPKQTILLDLTKPFEEILSGMKQKHRYNLKQAEKHELHTDIYSTDLKNHFNRFWKLLSDTANRQDFRTHSRSYYETTLEELEKDGEAHLLFVRKDDTDLAAMILITYDDTATYLHGASSQDKGFRAPFLLHAEAIKLSQSKGLKSYDFWGTDLALNPETHEWEPKEGAASAGTSRFKAGFGGTVVEYPGTFDLILKPFWYSLYKTLRTLRGGKRAFS